MILTKKLFTSLSLLSFYHLSGGYYCPYPTDAPLICEKGFFCPRGSYEMVPCDAFLVTECPEEGLEHPLWTFFDPAAIVSCLGSIFLIYWLLKGFNTFKKHRKEKQENLAKKQDDVMISFSCEDDDGFGDDQTPTASGKVDLAYLDSMEDKGPLRMDIKFTNLGLVLKGTEKKVLDGVSGCM